jgi:hypothetical protein
MRQRWSDPAAVEAEIARIPSLALDALRRRWRAAFGRSPPAALSKNLLGRMIAFRLQERAFGGLDRESLSLLDGFARHTVSPRRHLKPGTMLVRDYQGGAPYRHRDPCWLRLAGHNLCQPLGHRARHHRHGLERPQVLRSGAA